MTVLQTILLLAFGAAVLLFFKPLLVGIVRALALAIRPRPPKKLQKTWGG